MKTYYNGIKLFACLLIVLFSILYFIEKIGVFTLGVGIVMSIAGFIRGFIDKKNCVKERS
jgi:hypothetical protein